MKRRRLKDYSHTEVEFGEISREEGREAEEKTKRSGEKDRCKER